MSIKDQLKYRFIISVKEMMLLVVLNGNYIQIQLF